MYHPFYAAVNFFLVHAPGQWPSFFKSIYLLKVMHSYRSFDPRMWTRHYGTRLSTCNHLTTRRELEVSQMEAKTEAIREEHNPRHYQDVFSVMTVVS